MINEAGTDRGGWGGALSPEGRNLLERELAPGERVVWACHPAAGVYARSAWAMSVVGLVFIGFSVVWFLMANGMAGFGAPGTPGPIGAAFSVFSLCGLLPAGVGVALLTSPVWMRAKAGRIVYAVTDRRALVVTPLLFGRLSARSFSPVQLGSMERVERVDGSGDLVFVRETYSTTDSDGNRTNRLRPVGFIGLSDVRAVEGVVRRLTEGARGEA